jgi:hypothetical protein
MISAKVSFSAVRISKALRRISPRTRGAVAAHPGSALSAASTASRQSASLAIANSAIVLPSEGSVTGNRSPVDPARQAPSMWRSAK